MEQILWRNLFDSCGVSGLAKGSSIKAMVCKKASSDLWEESTIDLDGSVDDEGIIERRFSGVRGFRIIKRKMSV